MASGSFTEGSAALSNKEIDFDTDTIKCMLVAAGYTHANTQADLADVDANRYGGLVQADDATLAGRSITQGSNFTNLLATLTTFSSVAFNTGTAIGVIVYHDTGVAGTSKLLSYVEFTVAVTPDGNNIDFTPNANGVLRFDHT